MREKRVIVAIVQDEGGRFLVTFNPRWGGYAFPMRPAPDQGDAFGPAAIAAVEEDLGCRFPKAASAELDYMGCSGVSGSTREPTAFEYWIHTVEPKQALDLAAAPVWNGNQPMFLSYDEIIRRNDLTWSTPDLTRDFVDNQEAVLAVVARAGDHGPEYLLIENTNYGGLFFPCSRVKAEIKPEGVAVRTVRADLGYRGPVKATLRGDVTDVHFSGRFQRERSYRFHICEVLISDIDLHRPGGPLELALTRRGKRFQWLGASELNGGPPMISPTLKAVRNAVINLVPSSVLSGPSRHSEGGIALIERSIGGKREWLAQWNEKWRAFFFVGGHRHEGESFHDCVVREIDEELGLGPMDCPVSPDPAHHLEYRAVSGSAGILTSYRMELFVARPTPAGLESIGQDPRNKWLDESGIRRLESHDARPVSVTMASLLGMAGVIVFP